MQELITRLSYTEDTTESESQSESFSGPARSRRDLRVRLAGSESATGGGGRGHEQYIALAYSMYSMYRKEGWFLEKKKVNSNILESLDFSSSGIHIFFLTQKHSLETGDTKILALGRGRGG